MKKTEWPKGKRICWYIPKQAYELLIKTSKIRGHHPSQVMASLIFAHALPPDYDKNLDLDGVPQIHIDFDLDGGS